MVSRIPNPSLLSPKLSALEIREGIGGKVRQYWLLIFLYTSRGLD